jgi:hypothetical protein
VLSNAAVDGSHVTESSISRGLVGISGNGETMFNVPVTPAEWTDFTRRLGEQLEARGFRGRGSVATPAKVFDGLYQVLAAILPPGSLQSHGETRLIALDMVCEYGRTRPNGGLLVLEKFQVWPQGQIERQDDFNVSKEAEGWTGCGTGDHPVRVLAFELAHFAQLVALERTIRQQTQDRYDGCAVLGHRPIEASTEPLCEEGWCVEFQEKDPSAGRTVWHINLQGRVREATEQEVATL